MFSASAVSLRLGVPVPDSLDHNTTFSDLTEDSRSVCPGSLFFAIRGFKMDGHQFVEDAFKRGAAACVVDENDRLEGRPGFVVPDVQLAFSLVSALAFDYPSEKLSVIAVTGTNGKTTTNWIVYHLLNRAGFPASRLGTLGAEIPGEEQQAGALTTPGAKDIQKFLAGSAASGCKGSVLEASSHALAQRRIHAVKCDIGVFTNLTRDHLDYHKTFEDYFAAKCELFHILERSAGKRAAIVNVDDSYGQRIVILAGELSLRVFSYGFSEKAEYRITNYRQSPSGASFSITADGKEVPFTIPYIGEHNAHNFTAAILAVRALGIPLTESQLLAADLPQVPGRLEAIDVKGVSAYIDYAHTPDALEHALKSLRPITNGKLWVLFGCGGDRDRGKRPQMAEVAFRLADEVVVTSDNPRTENPEAIIADIIAGSSAPAVCEPDRRAAIHKTLRLATRGDVVLLAGKGHEDYQIIGTEKLPFSDAEEVRQFLSA